MIKIGRFVRESIENKLKESLRGAESFFLLQYSGLSSVQMTVLRGRLSEINSRLLVAKNSLMHRALKGANIEGLDNFVNGPTAIVFARDDINTAAKALTRFAKENTSLNLAGGFFQSRVLSKRDIEYISNLPSKEILRAKVVMLLSSPLSNLVFTLKGNLNKLVIALSQIKEKKDAAQKT